MPKSNRMNREDIESCQWEHQSKSVDRLGITWEEYKIVKDHASITWAEPMGEYWVMKISGQMQWGEWRQYPIEIYNTHWGGFTGAIDTQRIYKGDIPDVAALKQLMKWMGIGNSQKGTE